MQIEQLGPYRLGKKLGQGGMGAVYMAVDAESGQPAAVKVLSPHLAEDEGFRVRFEAEIDSLKKLRHPNIVRLFGYGEEGGMLFYAMELVEGTSLEDELRAGRRFEWREATQIAIKLCRALKHAHDHGIIHRDLKPANLLLAPDGEVKLSDFGIARLFGNTRLTVDGGVIGTAEYMAPEQAEGRTLTDRCDQYSLGGVLYALLTGRPPFRAKSMVEMLQLQRYAEPEPVDRFAPQTPKELVRIVHQLLEKDPAKRFPNTLILSRSLEAMERGLSISLSRAGDDFEVSDSDDPTTVAGDSPSEQVEPPKPYAPSAAGRGRRSSADDATILAPDASAAVSKPNLSEPTLAFSVDENSYVEQEPPRTSGAAATRYTKVDERRRHVHDEDDSASGALSPQTIALALALLLLLGGGIYFTRPVSADKLYATIDAATSDGDVTSLRESIPLIDRFVSSYPNDPRSDELQALRDEIERPHPIQRAYTEAKRYALINPERAAARFQAIVDLYDEGDASSDLARHYVKLSRQQLKRLDKQTLSYVSDDQALLQQRLDRANELAKDAPQTARKIYEGIIELYGDKPWAEKVVREARARLGTTP